MLGLSLLLMFNVPAALSQSSKTVYAFITYAFAQAIGYTIFCLAQSAIVTVVSYDPADRSRFTAWGFAIINLSSVLINIMTPLILAAGGGANFQGGWTRISTIFAIATTVLIALMGLFLKEKEPPAGYDEASSDVSGEKVSWWTIVKFLLKDRNTWILVFIHVFAWMIQVIQGIEAFFYRDVLGDMRLYSIFGNIYVVAVVIGILSGPVLSKRVGNRNKVNIACIAISLVGCLGYIAFASLETTALFGVCLFLKGFGYGPLLGSAFVYSSDLSDYNSEKYHIVAAETASMTSSVGIKVGVGVGAGMAGWILSFAGYDATLSVQSAATQSGIHMAFALAPAIFNLLTLICLCGWKHNKN